MSESVQQALPIAEPDDRIEVLVSEEQDLVIRKAAELVGWTVEQYVLAAALDRAERDLYEHATLLREPPGRAPDDRRAGASGAVVDPFVAVVTALG
jgi:hypothetical protein